jgi:hypothetical protein
VALRARGAAAVLFLFSLLPGIPAVPLFVAVLAFISVCAAAIAALGATAVVSGTTYSGAVALMNASFTSRSIISDFEADAARIASCARLAAIEADILAMPMGYNTLVGDMGTVLSGGQKQRLLLARALYKQPRILALDEATSHLDVDRERSVNEAVRGLALTRICIAPRAETIAMSGRVIALWGDGATAESRPRIASVA